MDNGSISRAQLVYNWVKSSIREGTLAPGTRLKESEIAQTLGVSRTPVREAINRLISEGQVALNAARGFSVAELDKQQILAIYDLREFLEGAAARLAAQHAVAFEIEAMREVIERSLALGETPKEQARLNKRFHMLISLSSHNRYLEEALTRLYDFLFLVPGTTFQIPGRVKTVYQEHTAILIAIEARDMEGAEKAAREHVRKASQVRMRLVFENY